MARVKVRARVRVGERECSYSFFLLSLPFFLVLQNKIILSLSLLVW